MLCGVQAKGLSYQATSKMLERQANNVLKCRTRAWLSRLMSWRTLTSNTHGLTGLVAQANWGNLWPLCHFPLHIPPFRHCIVVARLFGICSVIRVLSAYAKGGMAILIANRIMHFFVPLLCAINHATRMLCTHQHTHTHTSAQSTQLLSVLIWFMAYSWLAKRTQP